MNCILLTKDEVGSQLGFSRSTIDRERRKGLLPCKIINRSVRFTQKDIDTYLERISTTEWRPKIQN